MAQALDLASRLGLLPFEVARLSPTVPGAIEFPLALRRLPDNLDKAAQRTAFVASLARLDLPEEPGDGAVDIGALKAEAMLAVARAEAIEASTTWRLTAPLRRMVDGLRARRRA
jgi:hypothetical protein